MKIPKTLDNPPFSCKIEGMKEKCRLCPQQGTDLIWTRSRSMKHVMEARFEAQCYTLRLTSSSANVFQGSCIETGSLLRAEPALSLSVIKYQRKV